MQNQKSVSQNVLSQIPEFIRESAPLLEAFLSSYYRSQEKTGRPLDIINNFNNYLDVNTYDLSKLNGKSLLINNISADESNIQVESVDGFVEEDGTILVDNEVVYYERTTSSPSVSFSSGISLSEFYKKKVILFSPYQQFDGTTTRFSLTSNNEPVFPPDANHLMVKLYGQYQVPGVDFLLDEDEIVFTTAPRAFDALGEGDDTSEITFEYLKGFDASEIQTLTLTQRADRRHFGLTFQGLAVRPSSPYLVMVYKGGQLLVANEDYYVYNDTLML